MNIITQTSNNFKDLQPEANTIFDILIRIQPAPAPVF